MSPDQIIRNMAELDVLRKALAKADEYQPGKARVSIDFNQPIKSAAVRRKVEETAMTVVRDILTAEEMRARMVAVLSARVAVIEAKFPAGVVDGG